MLFKCMYMIFTVDFVQELLYEYDFITTVTTEFDDSFQS